MRVPLIDPVKAIAAQFIVWHHMMLYSNMRGPLEDAFPAVVGFLANEAKYAVQVFLVIGGFLAAHSFEKYLGTLNSAPSQRFSLTVFIDSVGSRYSRLIKPFGLAMLVAVVSISLTLKLAPASDLELVEWRQFIAHLFLLHDVLGVGAISAGVWYIAIDFQLFVLFGLVVLISQYANKSVGIRVALTASVLMLALILSALLLFNRMPEMEAWAPYFFGSYGLGVVAHRAVIAREKALGLSVIVLFVFLANTMEYRERLLVAGATACFLMVAPTVQNLPAWMKTRFVNFFNQSSYPLFLIHYPVAVLLFALVDTLELHSTEQFIFAALTCYGVCLISAKGLMNAVISYEKFEMRALRFAQPYFARLLEHTSAQFRGL